MNREKKTGQKRKPYLLLFLFGIILICAGCTSLYTASTIQLMKTEGTVDIANGRGKEVLPVQDMKLYSGYHMETMEDSYAWLNLDRMRLAKMDVSSQISIDRKKEGLEIFVASGNLYFNIKEPLKEDETLDIRTSNMAVGIRGTCGWVEVFDQWNMDVYILEGKVACTMTDKESGESQEVMVAGGERAKLAINPGSRGGSFSVSIEEFTEEDIAGFVREELEEDVNLCEKILEDSGLNPANLLKEGSPQTDRAVRRSGPSSAQASSWTFAAAVKEDGSLWMWGDHMWGANLLNYHVGSSVPVKVLDHVASVYGNVVTGIHGDVPCTLGAAVQADGSLWTWGDGPLGDGKAEWWNIEDQMPKKVMDDVVSVSFSEMTAAVVKKDHSLWMWGTNDFIEADTWNVITTPIKMMDDVASVSTCAGVTAAVQTDGSLWIWGNGRYGRLGNGTLGENYSPSKIMENVAAVSVSEFHVAALQTDGSLWVWGSNEMGQLGNGSQGNDRHIESVNDSPDWTFTEDYPIQTVPIKVMDNVVMVSTGKDCTAAVTEDGSLWMWGAGNQLGNGEQGNKVVSRILKSPGYATEYTCTIQDVPVKVMEDVASVNAATEVMAVKKDGSLWVWGNSVLLFQGESEQSRYFDTPVKVMDGITLPEMLLLEEDGQAN